RKKALRKSYETTRCPKERGRVMNVLNRRTYVVVAALVLIAAAGSSSGAAATGKAVKKPSVSISNAAVAAGNSGTAALVFRLRLSAPAQKPGSVRFTTADGTATAGGDYQSASGTVRFNRGDRTKTISITVLGDTFVEPDETLTVRLSSPVNVKIAK